MPGGGNHGADTSLSSGFIETVKIIFYWCTLSLWIHYWQGTYNFPSQQHLHTIIFHQLWKIMATYEDLAIAVKSKFLVCNVGGALRLRWCGLQMVKRKQVKAVSIFSKVDSVQVFAAMMLHPDRKRSTYVPFKACSIADIHTVMLSSCDNISPQHRMRIQA